MSTRDGHGIRRDNQHHIYVCPNQAVRRFAAEANTVVMRALFINDGGMRTIFFFFLVWLMCVRVSVMISALCDVSPFSRYTCRASTTTDNRCVGITFLSLSFSLYSTPSSHFSFLFLSLFYFLFFCCLNIYFGCPTLHHRRIGHICWALSFHLSSAVVLIQEQGD